MALKLLTTSSSTTTMTCALQRVLLLLTVAATLTLNAHAVHVTVLKASTECFSVDAHAFKHGISLNYEVLHGVADEFRAQLTDGKGARVFEEKGPSGRYVAPIGDGAAGEHTVCFANEVEAVGDVVVGFSLHADDPAHEVLSNADATRISTSLVCLRTMLLLLVVALVVRPTDQRTHNGDLSVCLYQRH